MRLHIFNFVNNFYNKENICKKMLLFLAKNYEVQYLNKKRIKYKNLEYE